MGGAKDIVEFCGVPRLSFSDFPLGNAATLELALKVLESAIGPRTTVQNPLRWSDNPDWKLDFSNIDQLSAEEIARRRAEFDANKEVARQQRVADGVAKTE